MGRVLSLAVSLLLAAVVAAQVPVGLPAPRRVLLDAHNAYPYQGRWTDRIDRALATGIPLAIEQDLVWRPSTSGRPARSIVSHGEPFTEEEPTLRDFFERIRPIATQALASNSRHQWPLITLNLDFKDRHPEHFAAIWDLLGEFDAWLTTAARVADAAHVQPMTIGPVLVLTGADPAQRIAFHDAVPVGSRLRLFGAVPPDSLTATNYLRWSNNPWNVIEPEGQNNAGDWTSVDERRLTRTVRAAHDAGLWIRFYTLNGHSTEHGTQMGWSPGYNFGSLDAARIRWRAAMAAGVDFIATDQYEELRR
jgi:glycerophosphoryl diester phosphodiesterase